MHMDSSTAVPDLKIGLLAVAHVEDAKINTSNRSGNLCLPVKMIYMLVPR